jgi:Holliday junction resolvasome RuvABC ATP-dependent DNA helicase subunit
MSFYVYAKRKFIGQEHIIRELDSILEAVKTGINLNLSFLAQSGHGKSRLGKLVMRYLDNEKKNSFYYVPRKGEIYFQPQVRIHFIDEVHKLSVPEGLYPYMDSDNYLIMIASNEYGELKEPLMNRCFSFIFASYSYDELYFLVRELFSRKGFPNIKEAFCRTVIDCCRGNPRIAKNLTKRLSFNFIRNGIPYDVEELLHLIYDILRIGKGGFTELDRRYLDFLNNVGGRASLSTIIASTRIPRHTILNDIEPFLLNKRLIQITSRGRICTEA